MKGDRREETGNELKNVSKLLKRRKISRGNDGGKSSREERVQGGKDEALTPNIVSDGNPEQNGRRRPEQRNSKQE